MDASTLTPTGDNAPARVPRIIAGFAILSKLGQGGMGAVFRARQVSMQRDVALKLLPPAMAAKPGFVERFQREARASAAISHHNLVHAIDVGRDEASGLWYFAMELVDGPTLRQLMRRDGRIEERRALEIARGLAGALAVAHGAGIVHRDVKPENVLLTADGVPKLADLGLALDIETGAGAQRAGRPLGTPLYMAPEQIRGDLDSIGPRTDLYALGATIFHVITGKPLFSGANPQAIMAAHLREPAPRADDVEPSISAGTAALIADLLAKDPDRRPADATTVVARIDQLFVAAIAAAAAPRSRAPHRPITRPVRRAPKRTPWLVAALVGAAAALLLPAWWHREQGRKPRQASTVIGVPIKEEAAVPARLPPPAPVVVLAPPPAPAAAPAPPSGAAPTRASPPAPVAGRAASPAVAAARDAGEVFNGHRYRVFVEPLSWTQAQQRCERLGGHLVVIETSNEQAFIARMVAPLKADLWIGLGCPANSREWRWVDGSAVGYNNWNPGEPNEHGGAAACAARLRTANANTWGDRLVQGVFGFVCEWDSTVLPTGK